MKTLLITLLFSILLLGKAEAVRFLPTAANPRYFAVTGTTPFLLSGSHNFFGQTDIGATYPPPVYDFAGYVDFLANHGHNFTKMWAPEAGAEFDGSVWVYIDPLPWLRDGAGTAPDGNPKYDLTHWNDDYFTRLRSRVIDLQAQGIYVDIMLFAWTGVTVQANPFLAASNVNGISGDTNSDGYLTEPFTCTTSACTSGQHVALLAIEKEYIRRVVDAVNDLDNVMFEVINEAGGWSNAWQNHIVDYVHTYELTKTNQHPVGMTCQYGQANGAPFANGSNSNLYNSNADWVSPCNDGAGGIDLILNPPVTDGSSKRVFLDTDHVAPLRQTMTSAWVWKSFTRGYNVVYLDDQSVDAVFEGARNSMGQIISYANRINLAQMTPTTSISSTTYALALAGTQYLVFAPAGTSSFTVNFPAAATYNYEWFNPANNQTTTGTVVVGVGNHTFNPPFFPGDAVLLLTFVSTVSEITWVNNTTGTSGNAVVTLPTWSITNLPLQIGVNNICVNYVNANGSAQDCIDITSQSGNSIAITAPVSGPRYITTTANQSFSGTATCDSGTPAITVTDNLGGSATTTGTSWTTSLTLTPNAINSITITNKCASGTVTAPVLAIAYSPAISLLEMAFDENAGAAPQDVSGLANHGTFGANVAYTASAQKYGASALDFSGGSVTVTSTTIKNRIIGGFSIVAWVNPDTSTTTTWRAIAVNNYSEFLYAATDGAGGACQAGVPVAGFGSGVYYLVCPTTPLPPATYSCVAVTYDGTALTMYVNGVATTTAMSYQFPDAPASGTFQIGNSQFTEPFDGKIDEVRFKQYAMSAGEVTTACNTQIGTPPITAPTGLSVGSVGVKIGDKGVGIGF